MVSVAIANAAGDVVRQACQNGNEFDISIVYPDFLNP